MYNLAQHLPVSREEFREGMARLPAAVNIVATDGVGGRAGFTASAVCSVTDRPPTLLVCLNREASVYPVFLRNEVISVNTLGPASEDLSRIFGGKTPMDERFRAAEWSRGVSGAPILIGASVAFDCRRVQTSSIGTHDVIFCEVLAIYRHLTSASLVYVDRNYHVIGERLQPSGNDLSKSVAHA
ncbi:flavin reductase [Bradyrhizobium sp. BR 10289]|uniref:flavin reductase n=1 Tax=Bradyrhizobium sp. BR 10289 TaxID=2749993 RepID=UPI001C648A9E|nr:flavin reductase [Bradyrhizobium sp. BR 10289]MBW7970263.1 flavin reductase [Bradyrhizobium sp. BR 10289]